MSIYVVLAHIIVSVFFLKSQTLKSQYTPEEIC